jgi:replicative DNA helicase
MLGIPTPWETVNASTLGWCDGDTVIILAKSNVGKTWLALKIADYARRAQGRNVLIVSQEMPPERLFVRIDALGAGVSARRFRAGKLEPAEEARFQEHLAKDAEHAAHGWGGLTVIGQQDVRSVLDLEIQIDTYGPQMVIWDSFYLVTSKDWKDQGKLVADVKNLGERKGIPIICTSQFNRSVTSADTKADQNAAGWASAVIQDVDVVIGMFQTPEMKQQREMKLASLKVRDGEGFDDLLLTWDLEKMHFEEKLSAADVDVDLDDDLEHTGKFFNKIKTSVVDDEDTIEPGEDNA